MTFIIQHTHNTHTVSHSQSLPTLCSLAGQTAFRSFWECSSVCPPHIRPLQEMSGPTTQGNGESSSLTDDGDTWIPSEPVERHLWETSSLTGDDDTWIPSAPVERHLDHHGPWWRPSTTLPTSSTAGHRTRRHGSRAPRRRTHSVVRAPAISLVTEPVNIGSGTLHRLTHSFVRAVANPRLIRNMSFTPVVNDNH